MGLWQRFQMGYTLQTGWLYCIGMLVFLLLLSMPEQSEAGTLGSPIASGRPNTFTQFNLEYDLVQRDMNGGDENFSGESTTERILLQGIYGLTPFADLYLRVGVADFETASRDFSGQLGPAFGGGGRWTIYQKGDLRLGLGIQFLEFFTRNGSLSPRLKWTEIESFFGGELGGLERFTPYFGILFSKGRGEFEEGPTIRSDGFVSLFFGAEFLIYENYYFSSEARIISENSLTLRLNYHL